MTTAQFISIWLMLAAIAMQSGPRADGAVIASLIAGAGAVLGSIARDVLRK